MHKTFYKPTVNICSCYQVLYSFYGWEQGTVCLSPFLQLEMLSPDRPNLVFLLSREMYDSKITAFKENPFESLTVTNGAL